MPLCLAGMSDTAQMASVECGGNFINPIIDVCWERTFPMTVGNVLVVEDRQPDAPNPPMPAQLYPMGIPYRVRPAIGCWESMALADVTRSPYYMMNLGRFNTNIGNVGSGTGGQGNRANPGVFCRVHWYKYPLTYWLNVIASIGCLQDGSLDIGHLSELDPTWDSSSLSAVVQPGAVLFDSVTVQGTCAADTVTNLVEEPIDALFRCTDGQGSMYPLSGYVPSEFNPLQTSSLLSGHMAFKLHRQGIVMNSIGENTTMCFEYPSPIILKNRWRYHLVNKYPDADQCHPLGCNVAHQEAGKNMPSNRRNFDYLF